MEATPVKIANQTFERLSGCKHYAECVYDITDFHGLEIEPCEPNECGMLAPRLWFAFKNTRTALFLVNVSRTPAGKIVFGYDIHRIPEEGGSRGSACHPTARRAYNNPGADTLKQCIVNALIYMTKFEFYSGVVDEEVSSAAEAALRKLPPMKVYQMTIFDLL